VIAALGEDCLHPTLLAECLEIADELDLKPGLGVSLLWEQSTAGTIADRTARAEYLMR
jgi:hypothetical protein